ncbi:hypothetical protein [Sphingomonas crusticola]|uniref:hypothetical protein n=1 Tax=Sphingomonas crusticola TaxID=1697973 RepID=UPI0013C33409|nr:hypothetical protein [Sphingomonas crusticola]
MLLILVAVLAAPAPAPVTAPPDEVVVVGERMKRVRVVTRRDRKTGGTRCLVRRTSGDDGLDQAICEATLACAQTETKIEGMIACLNPRMAAVAQRFAKRSPAPEQ